MAGTLEIPTVGSPNSTQDPKVKGSLETLNNLLDASNKIPASSLAAAAKPFVWYTPKIIATEQSKTSASFVTMETADEVTGVVLPENGLIGVIYKAVWKSSASGAGRAAIFLGSNQVKADDGSGNLKEQEASSTLTGACALYSGPGGLQSQSNGAEADATTGVVAAGYGTKEGGGICLLYAAAGTYAVSLKFKSASGSVTAKNRKLWVFTLGV